jgi:SagB-type dehydrogenase family enzyme
VSVNYENPADYQRATEHDYESIRLRIEGLDLVNQPKKFKKYLEIDNFLLPRKLEFPAMQAFMLLLDPAKKNTEFPEPVTLRSLAQALLLGCGINARMGQSDSVYYLRSNPSAGALYPCEVYIAARDIKGLDDGLYHFHPLEFALYPLRKGDFSATLAELSGRPDLSKRHITAVVSTIFWRSSWKYRQRAYRYCLLDTGHLSYNLMSAARLHGWNPDFIHNFDDGGLNRLLGLNDSQEAAMAVIPLAGELEETVPAKPPEGLADIDLMVEELSPYPKDFEEIAAVHRLCQGSSTPLKERPATSRKASAPGSGNIIEIPASDFENDAQMVEAVMGRRSCHEFRADPISLEDLSILLRAATAGWPPDLLDLRVAVNRVGNVKPGIYAYDPEDEALICIKEMDPSARAARASLEQDFISKTAAVFFYTTDLKDVTDRLGAGGYRRAHIEAGMSGQRVYLAAEAMQLGACGIGALYDQEVKDLALPDKPESCVLYEMLAGPKTG